MKLSEVKPKTTTIEFAFMDFAVIANGVRTLIITLRKPMEAVSRLYGTVHMIEVIRVSDISILKLDEYVNINENYSELSYDSPVIIDVLFCEASSNAIGILTLKMCNHKFNFTK